MADRQTDQKYHHMRTAHGADNARSNGYRANWFFAQERSVLTQLAQQPGALSGIVLDIACGSGLMLEPLADADVNLLGVDFNHAACCAARANAIPVARGDAFALPLPDHTVQLVLNCQFLNQQQAADRKRLLAEIERTLAPGGRAIIMWRKADSWLHRVAHACLEVMDRTRGLPRFPQHLHTVRDVSDGHGLTLETSFVTSPLLPLRRLPAYGWLATIVGASNVVVLRQSQASAG